MPVRLWALSVAASPPLTSALQQLPSRFQMSADGLTLNTARFDDALLRLLGTSRKEPVEVMKQQGKPLFVDVALITPPASAGVTGRKAEMQGKAAVARDVLSLYGTPGDAYEAIANKSPAQASAFWFLHSQGENSDAADIVRSATGKSFAAFDGGTLHSRTAGGTRRRTRARREHVFYVNDPDALSAYLAEEKGHVWWLASGWGDALKGLGAALPYGVNKHGGAPGRLKVVANAQRIEITTINEVTYGRQVRDIERRIQWAMNRRAKSLDRAWEFFLNRSANKAGFKTR